MALISHIFSLSAAAAAAPATAASSTATAAADVSTYLYIGADIAAFYLIYFDRSMDLIRGFV
eukprot:COSAG05_NODE_751_length_7534_cov_3478.053800_1_plen_62_part_00